MIMEIHNYGVLSPLALHATGASVLGRPFCARRMGPSGSHTLSDITMSIVTGGELRNGVNGFLTSYATDSVRFSQQILDIWPSQFDTCML